MSPQPPRVDIDPEVLCEEAQSALHKHSSRLELFDSLHGKNDNPITLEVEEVKVMFDQLREGTEALREILFTLQKALAAGVRAPAGDFSRAVEGLAFLDDTIGSYLDSTANAEGNIIFPVPRFRAILANLQAGVTSVHDSLGDAA